MARKIKLTVFSRFLIVMLFLGPLAYMGASYYNGEDGLANLKNLLGIETTSGTNPDNQTTTEEDIPADTPVRTDAELLRLEQENLALKKQLLSKDEEILQLKKEIAELKSR